MSKYIHSFPLVPAPWKGTKAILLSTLTAAAANLVMLIIKTMFSSPLSRGFYATALKHSIELHSCIRESLVIKMFIQRKISSTAG